MTKVISLEYELMAMRVYFYQSILLIIQEKYLLSSLDGYFSKNCVIQGMTVELKSFNKSLKM